MSERVWTNISTFFGWVALFVLFGLITYTSSLEIRDLDLWLHLGVGQWICQHGGVPSFDILSCTIYGKPWVNHEWLFQVFVFQIKQIYGFNGLITMQSIVVAFTFLLLLFLTYNRKFLWVIVYLLFMVLSVYQSRFTIRPDIFSLLFFVLYIYFLSLYISRRWVIYVLVALQILWSNMHGFFFFGPLLVAVALISEFIKRQVPLPYEWNKVARLSDEEYRSLKIMLPILLLACCVNPLGIQGALYPLHVFFSLAGDNKIFFTHIVELQRPIAWDNVFSDRYLWYKVLIVLSAYSFVFNRRKIDISSFIVWVIFLGFSLIAIRNLVYFAVAAYMVFMVNSISTPWEEIAPMKYKSFVFKALVLIVLQGWIIFRMMGMASDMSGNGYFDFDTYQRKKEFFDVSKRVYPYKAVDFLVREQIRGNFFNDFNSGAYLVGRAYPNVRVFIDGRTEEYGAKFFEAYQKIWEDGNAKEFRAFEKKDNITGVFLNNAHQQIPTNALKMFHSLKDWSIVYLDDDAVIFLKQTPLNKPIIDKFNVDVSKWKSKPMDLYKIGTQRVDPFPFTCRAYILEILGNDEAAFQESELALKVDPDDGNAYIMLGKIYNKRKDYLKAFENYRLGTIFTGGKDARLGLAHAYEDLKQYEGAIGQYKRVFEASPKDTESYFGQARCYAEEGQAQKALDMVTEAKKLGLEDKIDVQKIHDIISISRGNKMKPPADKKLRKQPYDLKKT